MKPEKLLKQFQVLFKDAHDFIYAGRLKPTSSDFWEGGSVYQALYLALSADSLFVGDSSPKRTSVYKTSDISRLEIRVMAAGTYAKNETYLVRLFICGDTANPRLSIQIDPSHREELIQNLKLRLSRDVVKFEKEALPKPEIVSEAQEVNDDLSFEERLSAGEFGKPLQEKGNLVAVIEGKFGEVAIEGDIDVLLNETAHQMTKRLSLVPKNIGEITSSLPKGEVLLFFSHHTDASRTTKYGFISNRRIADGVFHNDGTIFAEVEYALAQVASMENHNGELVINFENDASLNFGAIDQEIFMRLEGILLQVPNAQDRFWQSSLLLPLSKLAQNDLKDIGQGVDPVVLVTTSRGAIAAWTDRVAIIKQGYFASINNRGKQQSQVFFFRDVIQISLESVGTTWLTGGIIQIVTPGHPSRELSEYSQDMGLYGQTSAGTFSNVLSFDSPDREMFREAVSRIQALWVKYREGSGRTGDLAMPAGSEPRRQSLAEEIKELQKLVEFGVLTEDEFKSAKAKLLS
jgi:hypothetical protein